MSLDDTWNYIYIYTYIQEGTHLKNRSVGMRGTRDHSLLRILTEEFNYCFQRSRPWYFFFPLIMSHRPHVAGLENSTNTEVDDRVTTPIWWLIIYYIFLFQEKKFHNNDKQKKNVKVNLIKKKEKKKCWLLKITPLTEWLSCCPHKQLKSPQKYFEC